MRGPTVASACECDHETKSMSTECQHACCGTDAASPRRARGAESPCHTSAPRSFLMRFKALAGARSVRCLCDRTSFASPCGEHRAHQGRALRPRSSRLSRPSLGARTGPSPSVSFTSRPGSCRRRGRLIWVRVLQVLPATARLSTGTREVCVFFPSSWFGFEGA